MYLAYWWSLSGKCRSEGFHTEFVYVLHPIGPVITLKVQNYLKALLCIEKGFKKCLLRGLLSQTVLRVHGAKKGTHELDWNQKPYHLIHYMFKHLKITVCHFKFNPISALHIKNVYKNKVSTDNAINSIHTAGKTH